MLSKGRTARDSIFTGAAGFARRPARHSKTGASRIVLANPIPSQNLRSLYRKCSTEVKSLADTGPSISGLWDCTLRYVRGGPSGRYQRRRPVSSGFSGTGVFTRASLKIGPVVWRNHRILAMDMKEISKSLGENVDGLLGMDFLNEFEIVVVDLGQHKLILR
jgi:hypothetical protein